MSCLQVCERSDGKGNMTNVMAFMKTRVFAARVADNIETIIVLVSFMGDLKDGAALKYCRVL